MGKRTTPAKRSKRSADARRRALRRARGECEHCGAKAGGHYRSLCDPCGEEQHHRVRRRRDGTFEVLLAACGGRCQSCGVTFTAALPAEIDHIVPLSRGGTEADDNLQLLCRPCNRSKGARPRRAATPRIGSEGQTEAAPPTRPRTRSAA